MNTDFKQSSEDYLRIEQAILYLENHFKDQPSLDEVAANVGLSEYPIFSDYSHAGRESAQNDSCNS
jgi:AraC-like DNA-binding protein